MEIYKSSERGKSEKVNRELGEKAQQLNESVKAITEFLNPYKGVIEKNLETEKENRSRFIAASKKADMEKEKLDKNDIYQKEIETIKTLRNPGSLEALRERQKKLIKEVSELQTQIEASSNQLAAANKALEEKENGLKQNADYLNKKKSLESISQLKPENISSAVKKQKEALTNEVREMEKPLRDAKDQQAQAQQNLNQKTSERDKRLDEKDEVKNQLPLAEEFAKLKNEIEKTEEPYKKAKELAERMPKGEDVEKYDELLKKIQKLTVGPFAASFSEAHTNAKSAIKLMAETYDMHDEDKFKDNIHIEMKKIKDDINVLVDKKDSQMNLINNELTEAAETYGGKSQRSASESRMERGKYKFGQIFGAKSVGEMSRKTFKKFEKLDFDSLATEIKMIEEKLVEYKAYDAAFDEMAKTKSIVKGMSYLANLSEEDLGKMGLAKSLKTTTQTQSATQQATTQQTSSGTILVKEEAAKLTAESVVDSYDTRAGKLIGLIEDLDNKKDTKKIRQINSGVLQIFAEFQAINAVVELSKEESKKLQSIAEKINGKLTEKAEAIGLETESKIILTAHVEKVKEHINSMIERKSEEIEALSTATYNNLIAIFSQAYKINQEDIEETLEEYVKRQKELKRTIRSRTPATNPNTSLLPKLLKEEKA
jgi:hypothetical protein